MTKYTTKESALEAVKRYSSALQFASQELQGDKEIVLAAIKQDGFALYYASQELQADREVVIEAVKQNLRVIAEQVVNAERAANYSKQLVNAEKLKFDNGESSLFMLNTRESKWLESELKLAEYKLKFMKAYLSIVYLKGKIGRAHV